jgi:Uma2 family endonuclease
LQQAARFLTPYEPLMALPEGITGEVIDGQLHTQPRPAGPHVRAGMMLTLRIGRGYDQGEGGPGGWWILPEPEQHFVRDTEVLVPDVAGWRRGRMPVLPRDHRFEVLPDWICEILSPSSASKDREIKMPIYASRGVAYAWTVDPAARTLEVYCLRDGRRDPAGSFSGNASIVCPPFEEMRLSLSDLWVCSNRWSSIIRLLLNRPRSMRWPCSTSSAGPGLDFCGISRVAMPGVCAPNPAHP